MQGIKALRTLREECRQGEEWLVTPKGILLTSIYRQDGEIIVVDNADTSIIYAIYSIEYVRAIANSEKRRNKDAV